MAAPTHGRAHGQKEAGRVAVDEEAAPLPTPTPPRGSSRTCILRRLQRAQVHRRWMSVRGRLHAACEAAASGGQRRPAFLMSADGLRPRPTHGLAQALKHRSTGRPTDHDHHQTIALLCGYMKVPPSHAKATDLRRLQLAEQDPRSLH
eukprot:364641-Chlamydomonas_euryale.AAC.2